MTVCMYMVGGLDRTGQDDATEKNASDYFWQVGASASFKKTSTCQMPFPSLSRDPAILVAVQQERRGEISRRHDSPERTYRGLAPYQSETYLSLHNMKRESRCVLQGKEKGEREHWIQRERWASSLYAPKETYISGPVTLHFDVISSRRCCCCCCSSVWQVAWQLCEGRRRSFFCCFAFVSFYDWPRTNVNWIYILISDILILSDRSSRRACESSASNYTALYIHISLLIGVYIMSYLFVFIGAMEFLVRVPFPLRRFRTTYIYLIYSYLSFCVLLWDEKKQVRVSCVRAGRPCRLSARWVWRFIQSSIFRILVDVSLLCDEMLIWRGAAWRLMSADSPPPPLLDSV